MRPRLEVLEERLTPSADVLVFTTGPTYIAPNGPSGAIALQLQDGYGNAANATSNTTINLSSSSSTGKFLSLSGTPLTNSSIVIPQGSSMALFEYEDSHAGLQIITAKTSTGSASVQRVEMVQPSLVFTTPPQTLTPGQTSKPITVQLQDANGKAFAATSSMVVNLYGSTGEFLDMSGKPLSNSNGFSSLTIAAGSSSTSFEYETTQTGFSYLSASTNMGPGGSASQSETVQYSLAFTTPIQVIATNKPSGVITIQLQDSNGKAVAAASNVAIDLGTTSSTGKFLNTSGQALTYLSVTIPKGSSSASIEYEDSQTGTPTISASMSDFSSTVQQAVDVGIPLTITTAPQTIAVGLASKPITLQLASAATSNLTIDLSSSSSSGKFLTTSGQALTSNTITIPKGSSSAIFEYEDSQKGLPTLAAQANNGSWHTFQQEAVGVSLVFTTAAQTLSLGKPSQPITVQLQDSSGKAVLATSSTLVSLSSTSFGYQFLTTSGQPLASPSITIAAGSSSASFEYEDSQGGKPTLKAAIGLSGAFGTLSGALLATQQENFASISSTPVTPIIITLPQATDQGIAPNQPLPITVQLQTFNGAAVAAASNVTIELSSTSSGGRFLNSAGKALINSSIVIPAGSNSVSFEYVDSQEGLPMLTLSYSGLAGLPPSNGLQLNVGGVSLAFRTASQTLTAGKPSGPITVQLQDSKGNAVKAQSSMTIYPESSSSTGRFLSTSGQPLYGGITIAAGSSSASFTYEDSVGGMPTLTAYLQYFENGINAVQQEVVKGPYEVLFTSLNQAIPLSQPSQPITVSLVDSTGFPAKATSATTVKLSSSSSSGQFLNTSGQALSNSSIVIPAGSSSASFEYKDSQLGFPTLTVSENGFTSQQQVAVGMSLGFTTAAQTVKAGQPSGIVTVQLQDSKGNAVKAPSSTTVYLNGSLSSNVFPGVQFLDPIFGQPIPSVTIPAGSSSASFKFKSTWGGTLTLSASLSLGSGGFNSEGVLATQKETIQGLSALVFTTSPQKIAAGKTSGTITVQLEDNTGKAIAAPSGGFTVSLTSTGINSLGFPYTKFFDTNGNPLPTSGFYSLAPAAATIFMPAGSSAVSFKFETTQAGTDALSAELANGMTANQSETVLAGPPTSLVFATPAQSLPTGVPSGSITVQLEDKYGNVVPAGGGGLTFNLSTSASGGKFLSANGDPLASSSITIAQGASSATFEYKDSKTGTPTLTATADGISNTQQETITSFVDEIYVDNTNDSGVDSLRAAIAEANAKPGSTIVFYPGVTGTIKLLSALPAITANTNILGPGANQLTIERNPSATGTFGGFIIGAWGATTGPIVTIAGLAVANFNSTGITNYGYLTLRQVDVSNNQVSQPQSANGFAVSFPYGSPGGIGNEGTLTVLDSTIADNTITHSSSAAVGIESANGSVMVINSTIVGNVNNDINGTGGIGIYYGSAYIASSTISGNTAAQPTEVTGGGPSLTFSSSSSGGIDSDGAVTLYNTIVAGNTGSPNDPTDVGGAFLSLGHNLVGKANSQSSGFVSTDQVGTTASPIDAKLGALANNGGPTPSMALLKGSPAISKGSSINAPATDQRGDPRPTSGAIDIGAYELTALPPLAGPMATSTASASSGTPMLTPNSAPTPAPTTTLAPTRMSPSPSSASDPIQRLVQDIVLIEQSLLSGNFSAFFQSPQERESFVTTMMQEISILQLALNDFTPLLKS